MKRPLLVLLLLICAALGTVTAGPQRYASAAAEPVPTPVVGQETFESIKDYLLTSAATDFHDHQPPRPSRFRKIRIGHVGKGKEASYRLCGEFLPADGEKPEWIPFATVKTSGYEQYIGGSTTYCNAPKMSWDTAGDLSSELKTRFDSLK